MPGQEAAMMKDEPEGSGEAKGRGGGESVEGARRGEEQGREWDEPARGRGK